MVYTVTVLDAELVPAEELQGYDAGDQAELLGNFTDYIYMVRVSIANQYNPFVDEKGINAGGYYLIGTDYILSLDDTCYYLANLYAEQRFASARKQYELILHCYVRSN